MAAAAFGALAGVAFRAQPSWNSSASDKPYNRPSCTEMMWPITRSVLRQPRTKQVLLSRTKMRWRCEGDSSGRDRRERRPDRGHIVRDLRVSEVVRQDIVIENGQV